MSTRHRRDLLTSSAFALTGIGLVAASWPFMSALGPDAETTARQQIFSLADLRQNGQAMLNIGGIPVLIFTRSQEEVFHLKKFESGGKPASWKESGHRSIRPDIMVCVARCTYDACIIVRNETREGGRLFCPCCASDFSLAGHRLKGPAPRNLDVPTYRFISASQIEFAEAPSK